MVILENVIAMVVQEIHEGQEWDLKKNALYSNDCLFMQFFQKKMPSTKIFPSFYKS